MTLGIHLLEGKDVGEDLKQLSIATTTASGKLGKICSAASSVLWSVRYVIYHLLLLIIDLLHITTFTGNAQNFL